MSYKTADIGTVGKFLLEIQLRTLASIAMAIYKFERQCSGNGCTVILFYISKKCKTSSSM